MNTSDRFVRLATAALAAASAVAAFLAPASAHAAGTAPKAGADTAPVRIGTAPRVPSGAVRIGASAPGTVLHLAVNLRPRDPQGLQKFISAVSTKGSPQYHRYLTKGRFAAEFGPSAQTVARVQQALRAQGLTPGRVSPDGLAVPVTSTAAQAAKAFSTGFDELRTADGRTVYQNTAAPTLPKNVAAEVSGVTGLTDVNLVRSHHTPARPAARGSRLRADAVSANTAPSLCSSVANSLASSGLYDTRNYYSASTLAAAYGMPHSTTAGSGASIGVFELENVLASNLSAYQSCYGTHTSVSYVKVDGGPTAAANASQGIGVESALDIEDLIGLAPGASVIDYEGPDASSATDQQVVDTYRRMVTDDKVQVISTSWGVCESDLTAGDPSQYAAENTVFQEAAAQGQTVVAASGDSGSTDCYRGSGSDTRLSVDDPAGQPYVTGVGGTTMNGSGSSLTQAVWNNSTGAGGGGVSQQWSLSSGTGFQAGYAGPGYSNACGATTGQMCRQVPDVSALADPDTGYLLALDGGQWGIVGGTSGAAPTWGALIALADTSTPCLTGGPLGTINPELYTIGRGTDYGSAFTDIVQGGNDFTPSGYSGGLYTSATGYDLASGLGTPKYGTLAARLCGALPPGPASAFEPLTPTRIMDTRTSSPVGANSVRTLQVTGANGVPSSGVTAVVLNVTATGPTAASYVTVYPAGHVRSGVSNLNFAAGETIPNLVTVPVGVGGKVDFYNFTGSVNLLADITGYYTTDTSRSRFTGVGPTRLMDTRSSSPVGPGGVRTLQIAGQAGLPGAGVAAVVLNVTATKPTTASYVSVYPDGTSRPPTSNLNFTAGETIPNLVTVPVGADGRVDFYNHFGSVDLIADITGYYSAAGSFFHVDGPARLLDTRAGSPVGPGGSIALAMPAGSRAVALNVTATEPTTSSYVTVYPDGTTRPSASNLNFTAGETIPNAVVSPVGADGSVDFYNRYGSVDLIADIDGYFAAS